jgi:hypothetical protein
MRLFAHTGLLALALVLVVGCEEPFSPQGPFLDRTVVYSLLAARSDTQFVRVFRTYYPPNDNPYEVDWETPDTSAEVVLSDGTQPVSLHDTVLTRGDGSSVHTYVVYPFHVEPGQRYSISVTAPGHEEVVSSTIVPGGGSVLIQNFGALSDLQSHLFENLYMEVDVSPQAAAFIPRLTVEFQVYSTGAVLEREVPLDLLTPDEENKNPLYPDIVPVGLVGQTSYYFTYSLHAYAYALRKIIADYGEVYFRQANCYLVQTDQALYVGYNIANGFRDAFSIRMDQPDFSNIKGGLGLFGSYNLDKKSYDLPSFVSIPATL